MKLTFTRGREMVATLEDEDGNVLNLAKHACSEPFDIATKYDDHGLPFFEVTFAVVVDDLAIDVEAVTAFGVPVLNPADVELRAAVEGQE